MRQEKNASHRQIEGGRGRKKLHGASKKREREKRTACSGRREKKARVEFLAAQGCLLKRKEGGEAPSISRPARRGEGRKKMVEPAEKEKEGSSIIYSRKERRPSGGNFPCESYTIPWAPSKKGRRCGPAGPKEKGGRAGPSSHGRKRSSNSLGGRGEGRARLISGRGRGKGTRLR